MYESPKDTQPQLQRFLGLLQQHRESWSSSARTSN
jgi:hypothetical protein